MSATAAKGHDVPNLLREAYPRDTAKLTARAADVPHETARNWLRRRATPSAATLLRAAANCERLALALENFAHARRAAREARIASAGDRAGAAPSGQQVTE